MLQCNIYTLWATNARKKRHEMSNRMLKENLRSNILIASIVAGLVAMTGVAAAQVVDDPPGSAFQTQGIREWDGLRATPSVWSRTAARARAIRGYAYARGRVVSHHRFTQHHYN
jgi:hypothetical protein